MNRSGINTLLADARAGKFDIVVSEALDRISRDQEDIAGIYKRLRHSEVLIFTLAEGQVDELHIGLKGTMNALFLKDLASKIRRGQRGRIKSGFSAGGRSYGYQVMRELSEEGNLIRGKRCLKDEEAAVVLRIYTEYASGKSPRKIAGDLNYEGIPAPRGGQWNASTINGHRGRRNGILPSAHTEKKIEQLKQKIERIVVAIAEGTDTPALRQALIRLESEKAELQKTVSPRPILIKAGPNFKELFRQKIERLEETLNSEPDVRIKTAPILRTLIDQIVTARR